MTSNQSTDEDRAQLVGDAMGRFIMLWAVDEIMNDVAAAARMRNDISEASENFCNFEPGFLHYRAGLAD